MWWRKEPNIDAEIVEATLKTRERLDRASSIARAAETCADVGNIEKAIEIAFDVSHLNYEVNTLFNASSMINRISKT